MVTQPAELTRLMDNARIHLPGALDDVLRLELFNVLDDFLQRTKFWQEEIDYVTVADRRTYDIVGTEDGKIVDLMSNVRQGTRSSVGASLQLDGTLVLDLDPQAGETFTATIAYTVIDPTDSDGYPLFPDEALQKYGDGIKHGLIGNMMMHPAKPYSNQQLAIFHTRKYSGAVANARADVRHKNIYGGQTWRFPTFAPGRQKQ